MARQPYWLSIIVGVSRAHSDTDVLGRTPSGEGSAPGRDLYIFFFVKVTFIYDKSLYKWV